MAEPSTGRSRQRYDPPAMGRRDLAFRGQLWLVAATVALAACSPAPTAVPSGNGTIAPPTPPGSPGPSGLETAAPTPTGASVRAYLVLGFGGQTGLVPVIRAVPEASAGPESAIRALLAGPTEVEASAQPAVRSAVPSGVELIGVDVAGGIATVNLSGQFEAATDDGLPTAMRVAQVVYTATQFPDVEAVRIQIDGALVTVIGPDRYPQDRPLARGDLTDQLAPLFVDEPAWGATISSPVHVAGLANAFEATFQLEIVDGAGRGLAMGTVTASCGTGCWGDFGVDVPFTVQAAGPGILRVFELSPRDGSRQNERGYPVTLTP